MTLDHQPDLIVDDGAQLLSTLHKERRDPLNRVIGLSEETTGAVSIIRAIQRKEGLRFPYIGVNTGLMNTNLTVCGKVVTVAGYG